MNRYSIHCGTGHNEGLMEATVDANGEWVRWEEISPQSCQLTKEEAIAWLNQVECLMSAADTEAHAMDMVMEFVMSPAGGRKQP